jgi:anti-sigma regulatory factor (Ser/Thr protein kinase)
MSRQVSLDLDPDPLAARQAREFVVSTVRESGLDDYVDTVQLLTSELVTNGVLHARTSLGVSVTVGDDMLTVQVHDRDPRPPIPRGHRADLLADIDRILERDEAPPGADERHSMMTVGPAGAIGAGRGLLLVESLADEWGVAEETEGKSVWFRLALTRPGPVGWS